MKMRCTQQSVHGGNCMISLKKTLPRVAPVTRSQQAKTIFQAESDAGREFVIGADHTARSFQDHVIPEAIVQGEWSLKRRFTISGFMCTNALAGEVRVARVTP
jgi:hypothetical protein